MACNSTNLAKGKAGFFEFDRQGLSAIVEPASLIVDVAPTNRILSMSF
jgi:hypothetical protein